MTKRPCKLCKAELIFMKGPKGKAMVFDAKPQMVWYLDEKRDEARLFPSHMPHHATCPNAEQFRKDKSK